MDAVSQLRDWIVAQGLAAERQEEFVAGLAERLRLHVPIARMTIGAPSLDPNARGVSFTWSGDGGEVEAEWAAHGEEGEALFRRSPIYYVQERDLTEWSWNLSIGEGLADHPLLERLRGLGIAHYAVKLVAFPVETQIRGMAFVLGTAEPAGFSARHHALVDALLPAIGLAVYRIELSRVVRELLRVYVGPRTGELILAGAVHRGDGEALDAAILFADMKGFTRLSETLPSPAVVALLNERFDVLDVPIRRHGGEILKFMGDGLLAVFPLGEGKGNACGRALAAAREALGANDAVNRTGGGATVGLDVALHVGEVFYGNVGAARRLDFTVIGPAVNLASRMEKLCDRLDRNLLLSRDFVTRCGIEAVSLGEFQLKGIARPQEVFGTPDGV